MADYQRIVDDVRAIIQGDDQTLNNRFRTTANLFAELCQQADERLRRCNDFLRQGLRSEALHLAEVEPPLLDVITALDFPEQNEWRNLLTTYGLPNLPPINRERAAALNQAYAEQEPLQALLRKHRRLALFRADPAERLATLRELESLDGKNSFWADEVKSFETARLRHLEVELRQARKQNNGQDMQRLLTELGVTPWAEDNSIRVRQLLNEHSRQALTLLVPVLQQAMRDKNIQKGLELRHLWDQHLPHTDLAGHEPVIRAVRPVFAWLNQYQFKQQASQDFDELLQQFAAAIVAKGTKPQKLIDLYEDLVHHKLYKVKGIPQNLVKRYWDRLDQMEEQRKFREKVILIGAGLGGAIIFVALLVWLVVSRQGG